MNKQINVPAVQKIMASDACWIRLHACPVGVCHVVYTGQPVKTKHIYAVSPQAEFEREQEIAGMTQEMMGEALDEVRRGPRRRRRAPPPRARCSAARADHGGARSETRKRETVCEARARL